jgi:hypothetical protein
MGAPNLGQDAHPRPVEIYIGWREHLNKAIAAIKQASVSEI